MDTNVYGEVWSPNTLIAEGAVKQVRIGREREQIVGLRGSKWFEAARQGRLFSAMTAVAGVDHAASITTAVPFVVHNPAGSGKILSIAKVAMGYVSGTLGAGYIAACLSTNTIATAPTGTSITPINLLAGGGEAPFSARTTATLAAAPSQVMPVFNVSASLATSALAPWQAEEDVDGLFLLQPGTSFSLCGVCGAAGTTPRVVFAAIVEVLTGAL